MMPTFFSNRSSIQGLLDNIKILKSTSYFIMSDRDANVAKAKLAEQAERYDDMAEAMKLVRRSALYLRLTVHDFYSIFSLTKEIKIFRFSVLMFSLFFTRMPASTVYISCSTAPHTLDVRLSVDVIPCKPTSPTCRERWRGGVNAIDVLAPSKRVMTKSQSCLTSAAAPLLPISTAHGPV